MIRMNVLGPNAKSSRSASRRFVWACCFLIAAGSIAFVSSYYIGGGTEVAVVDAIVPDAAAEARPQPFPGIIDVLLPPSAENWARFHQELADGNDEAKPPKPPKPQSYDLPVTRDEQFTGDPSGCTLVIDWNVMEAEQTTRVEEALATIDKMPPGDQEGYARKILYQEWTGYTFQPCTPQSRRPQPAQPFYIPPPESEEPEAEKVPEFSVNLGEESFGPHPCTPEGYSAFSREWYSFFADSDNQDKYAEGHTAAAVKVAIDTCGAAALYGEGVDPPKLGSRLLTFEVDDYCTPEFMCDDAGFAGYIDCTSEYCSDGGCRISVIEKRVKRIKKQCKGVIDDIDESGIDDIEVD